MKCINLIFAVNRQENARKCIKIHKKYSVMWGKHILSYAGIRLYDGCFKRKNDPYKNT